jgi:hypothetical protein
MSRKLLIALVAAIAVVHLAGTGIAIGKRGSSNGSLSEVDRDYPEIGGLKDSLGRLFDTSIDLGRDFYDPTGDWSADEEIHIPGNESRTLQVRSSDQTIRLLRLRNLEADVTVRVAWQPQAAANAGWWDVTAKSLPAQDFRIEPDGEHSVVILKGGGRLRFETEGSDDATVAFLVRR